MIIRKCALAGVVILIYGMATSSAEAQDSSEKAFASGILCCLIAFSLQPKHLIWLTVVNRKQNFLSHFLGFFSEYEFKA
jgi:hypothetical protein